MSQQLLYILNNSIDKFPGQFVPVGVRVEGPSIAVSLSHQH